MTLEEAIRSNEDLELSYRDRMHRLPSEEGKKVCLQIATNYHQQAEWLRELAERRKQPEIIRCKDCKHYKEWESEFTPNAVVTQCMADNFPIRKAIPDGWFCAGAERRTDEQQL